MKALSFLLQVSLVGAVLLTTAVPVSAKGGGGFQTGFDNWRAADGGFAGWTLNGVTLNAGALALDLDTAQFGQDPIPDYYGHPYYNGGAYQYGEATGPEMASDFGFREAIASWNADTPAGTWIEVQMRARFGERWTKFYSMGVWASDDSTIFRHSVKLQGDTDGYVSVDTLVLSDKKAAADGYQLKVILFSADGVATPVVRNLSVAYSTPAEKKVTLQAGNSANWNTLIDVPECSQMVYPDGGNVWCSPTSVSMVLGYWSADTGPCEPRVRAAVAGVYDYIYDGHGNWPFNTAYAASLGYEAYVARFTSMKDLEPWVKMGIPVIFSFAWGKGDLTGAAVSSSNGHLSVLVGFDAQGNPIVNDPAASADADVQRTYIRSELETLWLTNSGGTVYLIFPADHAHPGL